MPISSPPHHEPERADYPPATTVTPDWRLITRRDEILAQQSALSALCGRCAQSGVLDSLAYTLSVPFYAQRPVSRGMGALPLPSRLRQPRTKLPRLLLRYLGPTLTAAVFLYEYHVVGLASGLYIPGDVDGYRTLVAPPGERAAMAAEAAHFLLARTGARLALLSLPDGSDAAS